ncbi:MAG: hypothetical protein U0271_21775 [Polyangiaceae bacterium]
MQSIGGGTIRYVNLAIIECPERPAVAGQCTHAGVIEVLDGERVLEEIAVAVQDLVLVRDGASIAPATALLEPHNRLSALRARLLPGQRATVHYSAPVISALDESTGLACLVFDRGLRGDVVIELHALSGELLYRGAVPRGAQPFVDSGAVVKRGTLLATYWVDDNVARFGQFEALRRMLDVRPTPGEHAPLAPVDGVVESVDRSAVCIRPEYPIAAEVVTVPLEGGRSWLPLGCRVAVGDALTWAERRHRELLRIWGEDRFADHLITELELAFNTRGTAAPRVYWELVVRAMLAWRRVLRPGDTGLRRHQLVERARLDSIQRDTTARGGSPAVVAPVLRGVSALARHQRAQRSFVVER